MSVNYNPKIVTNGLILYLDAANQKSYPGSGTTWSNIIESANNATLSNGPTFDSANNGGVIVFDGTDDVVDSLNVSSYANLTIEMWVYDNRVTTTLRDLLTYNGNAGSYTFSNDVNGSRFRTDGNNLVGRRFTGITQPAQSQWYRLCYIKNGDLYVNNTKYTGTGTDRTYGLLAFANTRSTASGVNSRLNGKIASIKVYNRVLTEEEVLQNFNAQRGRFGI